MNYFTYNDGGRSSSGFKGNARDCVCRAISIVSGKDYKEVYNYLAKMNATQRMPKGKRKSKTASQGINVRRQWFKNYMKSLGFEWIPTMNIGSGCKVHLLADELPNGKIICQVSKHFVAVIDGVINDTFDPSRGGKRCVYGIWILK